MKKKSFHITIDEPCSESWQNMQPNSDGKFCMHCSKTVIDFTKQTSYEIKSYFQHHENTCGRFTKQQLTDTYTIYEASKFDNYKFVASLALGLLTLETLNAFSIDGKDFKNNKHSVQIMKMIDMQAAILDSFSSQIEASLKLGGIKTSGIQIIQKDSVVLKGKVIGSHNREALIGVNVTNGNIGVVTDIDGNFELKTENKFPLKLHFKYFGYNTIVRTILNNNDKINIELNEFSWTGEISAIKNFKKKSIFIKGTILDSLEISPYMSGTVTIGKKTVNIDSLGNFELKIKNKFPLTITLDYDGYEKTEKIISSIDEKIMVNLKFAEIFVGAISIQKKHKIKTRKNYYKH